MASKTAQRTAELSERLRSGSQSAPVAPVERVQLTPAAEGQCIEPSTIKLLTSKMKNAALSNTDLKNRFGLMKVEQIDKSDLNTVLRWIMDPQNG